MRSHIQGALVALHLVAITVMALPSVGDGLNRKAWADPTVQSELNAWHRRLEGWGLQVPRDAFEDHIWGLASGWADAHDTLKAPFWPYLRYCGTWQGWRMFVAPHRYPSVLYIDVEEGGAWRTVYVERSSTFDWHATQLDHHRMRSAMFRFSWPNYRKPYTQFAEWIGKEAASEFPEARKVRLRFSKSRTPTAAERRDGVAMDAVWHTPRVYPLDKWRP